MFKHLLNTTIVHHSNDRKSNTVRQFTENFATFQQISRRKTGSGCPWFPWVSDTLSRQSAHRHTRISYRNKAAICTRTSTGRHTISNLYPLPPHPKKTKTSRKEQGIFCRNFLTSYCQGIYLRMCILHKDILSRNKTMLMHNAQWNSTVNNDSMM